MKFAISQATTLLSLAGLVASTTVVRQSCPEAARFGTNFTVSPSTVSPGDNITVSVDFNCGIEAFGIVPKFLDYTIIVPAGSNNGHEQPILLARRDFDWAAGSRSDQFTTQVPFGFYFAGAPYTITLTNTYPIIGTDGSEVLVQGGISIGLKINVST